jgi:hypothetical protein
LLHSFVVDSATVVFNLDINVVAAVIRAQADFPHLSFSGRKAIVGMLDTMRHGISHQVNKRVGNLLNDVVVELGLAAGKVEFHFLLRGLGGIAYGA